MGELLGRILLAGVIDEEDREWDRGEDNDDPTNSGPYGLVGYDIAQSCHWGGFQELLS